jgi:hypothetical protein
MTTGMKICSVSLIIKRQNGSVLWLTPVIPATWEADVGRIVVQGQPREKHKTLSEKQNKNKRT